MCNHKTIKEKLCFSDRVSHSILLHFIELMSSNFSASLGESKEKKNLEVEGGLQWNSFREQKLVHVCHWRSYVEDLDEFLASVATSDLLT